MGPKPHSDRRRRVDRRARPTTLLGSLRWRGGRSGGRRPDDVRNRYVDRPRRLVATIAIFVVLSSAGDALLTMLWLDEGGAEANPLMAWTLRGGYGAFLAVKLLITGVGVWLLAIHQNFRVGLTGLGILAAGYVMLLGYHALLLLRM